jgi:hypothetical protein
MAYSSWGVLTSVLFSSKASFGPYSSFSLNVDGLTY